MKLLLVHEVVPPPKGKEQNLKGFKMRDLQQELNARFAGLSFEESILEAKKIQDEQNFRSENPKWITIENDLKISISASIDTKIKILIGDAASLKILFSEELYSAFYYIYLEDKEVASLYHVAQERRVPFFKKYKVKEIVEDIFTLSKNGDILLRGQKIKPGKMIKTLFPELSENDISIIVDTIKLNKIDISLSETKEIKSLYNSEKMKIHSCMTNKNVSLLENLGYKVKYLELNGAVIARMLVFGEFFSKVYSTSATLTEKIEEKLKNSGFKDGYYALDKDSYPDVEIIESADIEGAPEDYFIPYMDMLEYIHLSFGSFFFSNQKDGAYAKACMEDGSFSFDLDE